MIRGAGGALAVAVAALLVCCSADPHQEQDAGGERNSGEHYDPSGHKTRNLDSVGGNSLVREVREIRHSGYVPYLISRRFDYARPYGFKAEPWLAPVEYSGYYGDGLPKRNFDEIDRSGLDTFVKKRNFDEIDRSSLPFSYTSKRFNHISNFDKKRYRPEYPMDEIDLSHLPIGSKRSQDSYLLAPHGLL